MVTVDSSSPYLRSRWQIISRQEERVNPILRERCTSEGLIRKPHRKLFGRRRFKSTPDVVYVGRILAVILLRGPAGTTTHMRH